jgi:RHS repeat-associated protein
VRSFAYAYDISGMITQKVDMATGSCVTNIYKYDGLNRLLSDTFIQSGSNTLRQFTYDLAGNRLAFIINGLTNTYTYGIGNRLSNVSDGTGYTHDNAGNVSRIVRNGTTLDLVWNLQGQLLAVTNDGVLAESYTYDPLGRRLSTTTGGATVFHAYNGDECVADIDASGKLLRSYTWGQGIDNLLAMTVYSPSATNTYYAVKDHLGSIQALVNATGAVVESYRYDAYGNTTILSSDLSPLTSSQLGNRYMFQGREYSATTGLYNFRARWYDSQTGRWLSNDPIGISGGLNLYEFCGNNPIMYTDPSGLETKDGSAYVKKYTDSLMRNPFNPFNIWDTMTGNDIRQEKIIFIDYTYKNKRYKADSMGNIGAGYATTVAWGPIGSAWAMVTAELLYSDFGCTAWEDAQGSFRDNFTGMTDAIRDKPFLAYFYIAYPMFWPNIAFANWGTY